MAVDKGTEEDVHNADEGLGAEHTLPEIPRVTHLSEESDEQQSTTVAVHHLVDAVKLASEASGLLLVLVRRRASKRLDGLNSLDQSGLGNGVVVDGVLGASNHDDDEGDDVDPDGQVGEPTDTLQRSDATENHADHHEDDETGDEANLFARQLSNGCTAAENQDGNRHELLNGLGDVDEVTSEWTVNSEVGITERDHGEARGVEAKEDPPQNVARESSGSTKDNVQSDTRAESDTGKDERR